MQTRLSRFLEKAYSNKESFVDLEALEGSLSMVTLTGLLLGYPVIYCMSKERLNHACEELKKAELMLVEVSLRCKFVGSQNQLLSFSIPLSFIRHGNVAMDAIHGMEERFNAILGDHQELWEKLTVRIHHAPAHSVAL